MSPVAAERASAASAAAPDVVVPAVVWPGLDAPDELDELDELGVPDGEVVGALADWPLDPQAEIPTASARQGTANM
jgi:hypothetical protein